MLSEESIGMAWNLLLAVVKIPIYGENQLDTPSFRVLA